MAPAQTSYNYSQLVIKFMTARHHLMACYTQQVIEHLYHLAKLLDSIQSLSGQSLFIIDDFLVDLTAELPTDTFSLTYQLIDLFFDYLIQRGCIYVNPLRPSNPLPINSLPTQIVTPATNMPIQVSQIPDRTKTQSIPPEPQSTANVPAPLIEAPSKTAAAIEQNLLSPSAYYETIFKEELLNDRRLEGSSKASYNADIKQFINFCEEKHIHTLTAVVLDNFVKYLFNYRIPARKPGDSPKAYASKTIARKKDAIRAFIKDGIKAGVFSLNEKDYEETLENKRKDKAAEEHFKAVEIEDMHKMYKYVSELPAKSKKGERKQLMLEQSLLHICGVRNDELANLKVSNFDFATKTLRLIRTKGNINRSVPLNFLIPYIKLWITDKKLKEDDFLFPSKHSETGHHSTKTICNHIKGIAEGAGLIQEVTPHDLRATFAANQFYNAKTSVYELMELMGHTDINTTFGYVGKGKQSADDIPIEELNKIWQKSVVKAFEMDEQDVYSLRKKMRPARKRLHLVS